MDFGHKRIYVPRPVRGSGAGTCRSSHGVPASARGSTESLNMAECAQWRRVAQMAGRSFSAQRAGEGKQCRDSALRRHTLEHLSPRTARITRQHSEPTLGYAGQVQFTNAEFTDVTKPPQRLNQPAAVGWVGPRRNRSSADRRSPDGTTSSWVLSSNDCYSEARRAKHLGKARINRHPRAAGHKLHVPLGVL